MMGTIIGGTATASGLGMATGPLTGRPIYDVFAGYGWLFIGSVGLGIGAFLIALASRPFHEVNKVPATGALFPADQR